MSWLPLSCSIALLVLAFNSVVTAVPSPADIAAVQSSDRHLKNSAFPVPTPAEVLEHLVRRAQETEAESKTQAGGEGNEKEAGSEEKPEEKEEGTAEKDEEEEQEEEEEEATDAVSLAVTATLATTLTLAFMVLYLVNANAEILKKTTWLLLTNTLSIFVAVLWYQAIDTAFDELLTSQNLHGARLIVGFCFLLLLLPLFRVGSYFVALKGSDVKLRFYCLLGAHICGFALKEVFLTLQYHFLSGSLGLSFVALLAAMSLLALKSLVMMLAVDKFANAASLSDELRETWKENLIDAEDDSGCLCLSFLTFTFLAYAIVGKPFDGELPGEDDSPADMHIVLMYLSGACFGLLQVPLTYLGIRTAHRAGHRPVALLQTYSGMLMAWCLLFSAWFTLLDLNVARHRLVGLLVLATVFTILCGPMVILAEFGIGKITSLSRANQKAASRAITQGFALSIGFSWEQLFDAALENLCESLPGMPAAWGKIIASVLFSIVVLPALGGIVLPRAMIHEKRDNESAGADSITTDNTHADKDDVTKESHLEEPSNPTASL